MFISFEGVDCSGKTTQAVLFVNRLQKAGKDVILIREPGGTAISEKIRDILLNKKHHKMTVKTELLLFSAARNQLVSEIIQPALQQGAFVICDRFYDSTTAYQGYGRGLNIEEVKIINSIATEGIIPDLTIFLDINPDEIFRRRKAARLKADRMEKSGLEFFEKVRSGYHAIAAQDSDRFVIIDGLRSISDINNEIWELFCKKYDRMGN